MVVSQLLKYWSNSFHSDLLSMISYLIIKRLSMFVYLTIPSSIVIHIINMLQLEYIYIYIKYIQYIPVQCLQVGLIFHPLPSVNNLPRVSVGYSYFWKLTKATPHGWCPPPPIESGRPNKSNLSPMIPYKSYWFGVFLNPQRDLVDLVDLEGGEGKGEGGS